VIFCSKSFHNKIHIGTFLGLALVCPRIRYRCLVSLEDFGNAQNVLRQDFFEGTDLSFLYSNEQNELPFDILERLLAEVPTTTDSFICIDNLKAEGKNIKCMNNLSHSSYEARRLHQNCEAATIIQLVLQ
jgi:hypothetical protein